LERWWERRKKTSRICSCRVLGYRSGEEKSSGIAIVVIAILIVVIILITLSSVPPYQTQIPPNDFPAKGGAAVVPAVPWCLGASGSRSVSRLLCIGGDQQADFHYGRLLFSLPPPAQPQESPSAAISDTPGPFSISQPVRQGGPQTLPSSTSSATTCTLSQFISSSNRHTPTSNNHRRTAASPPTVSLHRPEIPLRHPLVAWRLASESCESPILLHRLLPFFTLPLPLFSVDLRGHDQTLTARIDHCLVLDIC
jgi:hypothetical protein